MPRLIKLHRRSQRQAELVGRAFDIETTEAVRALLPLAENYLQSDVFRRVLGAQAVAKSNVQNPNPQSSEPGLWSELRFRLRRPLGILTGTIDKLLIRPADNGDGVDIEIIDFKTNRFPRPTQRRSRDQGRADVAAENGSARVSTSGSQSAQGLLDFETTTAESAVDVLE